MKQKLSIGILAFVGILVLILDTKTALLGAAEGVELCLTTLIPSLFPFLVLSLLLTSAFGSSPMPARAGYFLMGLLGGYPVGAKNIAYACRTGQLDKQEGSRMLCYCNNAGPAFLFGVGMALLGDLKLCFLLWAVHILSALILAAITPKGSAMKPLAHTGGVISLPEALHSSLKTMALICGWVVRFRVMLSILHRWGLGLLPDVGISLVYGMLELSNGIVSLQPLQPAGLRFALFAAYLGFGGLCVVLQTVSMLNESGVKLGYYLWAKLTQSAVSVLLAWVCQGVFSQEERWNPGWMIPVAAVGVCMLYGFLWKKAKFQ